MASTRRPCPTCGFAPATVSPSDAALAARSLPRRYRALLARPDDDQDDVAPEAVRHAAVAADELRRAAEAVGRRPVVGARSGDSVEAVLDRIEAAAVALAEGVERVPPDGWKDQPMLDAALEGVHAGVHHLREAGRVS